MGRRHTLIINLTNSRCGACGEPADPHEQTHHERIGYRPGPGCGERWALVTSDYSDHNGLYDRIRAMRPDLTFINPNGEAHHGQ